MLTTATAPQSWPFPGITIAAADWAERLVAMSLLQRAPRHATPGRGFAPAEAARPRPSLTAAIAGIVAIAAQRANAAGTLPTLREAILRAIDDAEGAPPAAEDPREDGMACLAPIDDCDAQEGTQLMSLMQRQMA